MHGDLLEVPIFLNLQAQSEICKIELVKSQGLIPKKFGTLSIGPIFRTFNTFGNPFKDAFRHKRFSKPAVPNKIAFLHTIEGCNKQLNRLFFWYRCKRF